MISFNEAKAQMESVLHRWGIKNRLAFTGLLIGGIMAIMIGSVLLVVSYVVINAVSQSATAVTSGAMGPIILDPGGLPCWKNASCVAANGYAGALNSSYASSVTQIIQALGIIGIALVVTGIAVIIYVLIGLGGVGGGSVRQR